MVEVFAQIDTDKSGMISENEFNKMKESDKVTAALELLKIESQHLLALGESIFGAGEDGEEGITELSFSEFLEMAIHLRPENNATVLDIIELRHVVGSYKGKIENKILDLEYNLARQEAAGTNETTAAQMQKTYTDMQVLRQDIKEDMRNLKDVDQLYHRRKRELDELKRRLCEGRFRRNVVWIFPGFRFIGNRALARNDEGGRAA